jgi:hypothetical protein
MNHPIQPLITDDRGVLRFKENTLVDKLLDIAQKHGYGLNQIVADPEVKQEDLAQLYQLIGYSLSGYGELNQVTDQDFNAASVMSGDPTLSAQQARIQALEVTLSELRNLMATPIATLYGIHEDDLKHGRP